jgi:sn-glycerol 3-phosphate transport system permease protein
MILNKKRKAMLASLIKVVLGVIVISPIIYAFFLSFMPFSDIYSYPPKLFPGKWIATHYKNAMGQFPFFRYSLNTFIDCLITITIQIITSCLAAYALVFFDFRGKKLMFTMILATMMIPGDTTIIANYLTICNLKLNDTYIALSLPALASGMGIFLMRQAFLVVPRELKEAAEIDGCGNMKFLSRILFPICLPSISGLSLYTFVRVYNHYLWPLLVTNSKSMRTMQIGMSYFTQEEASNFGATMAGAMLCLIIPLLVFVIGHKYLIKGMTAGSVKG